jgi:hypothetical protein
VLNSPTVSYPSESQSAQTIQTLIASYLAHNGYVASARGFARDVEDEERAFGKLDYNLLKEGEEKEVSRRQRTHVI